MRFILISVLMGGVILLLSSCATVPTGPLASGEVRLLSIEVPGGGGLMGGISYGVNVVFESEDRPEVKRACFKWSGDGPYCYGVKDVNYGSPGSFTVWLRAVHSPGFYTLECYAQYTQDGVTRLTNVVDTAAVEKAIAKYTPRGTEQLNLNAFKSGYDFARKQLQEQTVPAQVSKSLA